MRVTPARVLNVVLLLLLACGVAFAAGQGYGPGSALDETTRTVESQPAVNTDTAVDPNQNEAAADFAANPDRAGLWCQNVGTTAARFRVGAATGGTVGFIVGGGLVANDGNGASWSTNLTGAVYIYDMAGAGNADLQCHEEEWK